MCFDAALHAGVKPNVLLSMALGMPLKHKCFCQQAV